MEFRNDGESVKIRIRDSEGYLWIKVRKGGTIDLPKEIGERHNFIKMEVTEWKIGQTKVETKQFEDKNEEYDEFFKELTKIKGIGPKTAKDIVLWGTKEELIKAIKSKSELPFRDDIVIILKNKFGGNKNG